MHDIDPADLIEFANRWKDLGSAITEQVEQVLDDPRAAAGLDEDHADLEVNPNAIRLAQERLQGLHDGIDEALADFLDEVAG